MTQISKAADSSVPDELNELWSKLLIKYPLGVSSTSTTKYDSIRKLLANVLDISEEDIYATGAKTRTSNLDTRLVQGNQAGRYTKVGVAFMQIENDRVDVEKLSNSAVTTCRKFVDGNDKTQYDSILIFVESSGRLQLTRIIQPRAEGYYKELLGKHFTDAKVILVGNVKPEVKGESTALPLLATGNGILPNIIESFVMDAKAGNLLFHPRIASRIVASLLAKRFLILTGLAGSGKTKVAQAFARWITPSISESMSIGRCCELIPVGADWTSSDNILGYPNGLDRKDYIGKPALNLIMHAIDNPDTPHFLILDEMNLSHVERYFADILSIIESNEGLELYSGEMDKPEAWRTSGKQNSVPPRVNELPGNCFIIGTVNVDETTYMFSPKVLDRANVIEFRMDVGELKTFLDTPAKPDMQMIDGKGKSYGKGFVEAAKSSVMVSADVSDAYTAEMVLFFSALQGHGAEFGYRTAHEAARFIYYFQQLGSFPDGNTTWFSSSFDCVVFQKFLPKLHGSRVKLGPLLKKLWFLCVNDMENRGEDALIAAEEAASSTAKKAEPSIMIPSNALYPMSAEKIGRMWRLLNDNGFTSFAEA